MKTVDLLATMLERQQQNHDELVKAVNAGFTELRTALSEHTLEDSKQFNELDRRLRPIEGMRRTVKTFSWLLVGQALTFFGLLAAYALHIHK